MLIQTLKCMPTLEPYDKSTHRVQFYYLKVKFGINNLLYYIGKDRSGCLTYEADKNKAKQFTMKELQTFTHDRPFIVVKCK